MDPMMWSAILDLMSLPEAMEKTLNPLMRSYVRETKAMASTLVDIKEYSNGYALVVDIPGVKSQQIKIIVEDENVLIITGEHKREDAPDEKNNDKDVKYLHMESRVRKFMRKFTLPEDYNHEKLELASHHNNI